MTTVVGSSSAQGGLSRDLRLSGREGGAASERLVPGRAAPFASHFHRARAEGLGTGASLALAPQAEQARRLAARGDPPDPCPVADTRGSTRDAEIDADRGPEELAPRAVGSDGPFDPMFQILVPMTPRSAPPPSAAGAPTDPHLAASTAPHVDQLLSRLVRRVAWSGNGRTGSARLELGAGALEGATLTVHADEGVVRVSLDLPPGIDGAAWRDRIAQRLCARGLELEALEIT